MKSFSKKILLASSMLLFLGITFADDAPISACKLIIGEPDTIFYSSISANANNANSIAQALAACNNVNICAEIGSNDCAETIANRLFAANYYSLLLSSNTVGANGSPQSSLGNSAPMNNGSTSTKENSTQTTKSSKTRTTNDSSIHWF